MMVRNRSARDRALAIFSGDGRSRADLQAQHQAGHPRPELVGHLAAEGPLPGQHLPEASGGGREGLARLVDLQDT